MAPLMTEDDFWSTRAALVEADDACQLAPADLLAVFRDEDHLRRYLLTASRFSAAARAEQLYLPDEAATA